MFSNDEAHQLIKLPKIVNGDGSINLSNGQTRLVLTCVDAPEYNFIAEITLNKKINFKISLHHQ